MACLIEQAARIAFGRARRLRPIVGYTHDEALQDARIGAWGVMDAPAESSASRLSLMALAGYRNILDGRTARWKRTRGGDREQSFDHERMHYTPNGEFVRVTPEPEQPDTAAELIAARETLAAIERLRHPLPILAAMLIAGHTQTDCARAIGMDEATMSKHRRRLQTQVLTLLERTAP